MKWFIWSLILLIVLGSTGGYFYYRHRANAAAEAAANVAAIATVRHGSIETTVSATGRVVSNLDVEIKAKASGEIIKLPFDVSDVVHKGELLVELDPVDENRAVALAEASLDASKAKLDAAKQNLEIAKGNLTTSTDRTNAALPAAKARAEDAKAKADRMRQLMDKKLASQEDYDTANTTAVQAQTDLIDAQVAVDDLKVQEMSLELRRQDIRLAASQVQADQITLDNARQRLKDTKVVSPIDGVVADRTVQIGQIISSGITNVGGGTAIITLSDLSRIFVTASVDESDIGRVKLDQDVQITADAYPGQRFKGKVVRIATRGINTSNVVTFDVKIEVLGKNMALLKPEMTANVKIIIAKHDDTLTVPVRAVYHQGKQAMVDVVDAQGNPQPTKVELGLTDNSAQEITAGLTKDQKVLVHKGQLDSKWSNSNRKRGPHI